eukprot:TRINITY_DN877_c1_g1_i1.p1 TRINITY_DN877_c1_g1~~TRINITY_DN877_c1_g1_i1.p1  ORF type:complete len:1226 (-),score=287.24 TRINITY_DN877_c1_g1_i1:44-3721(-)
MTSKHEKSYLSQAVAHEQSRRKRKERDTSSSNSSDLVSQLQGKIERRDHEITLLKQKYARVKGDLKKYIGITNSAHLRSLAPSAACLAAKIGKIHVLATLLAGDTDIHAPDYNGFTSLHCAVTEFRTETVKYLLGSGANLDMEDYYGRTALDICMELEHCEIAQTIETAMTRDYGKSMNLEFGVSTYLGKGNSHSQSFRRFSDAVVKRSKTSKLSQFFGKQVQQNLGTETGLRSLIEVGSSLSAASLLRSSSVKKKKKKKGFKKLLFGKNDSSESSDEDESDEESANEEDSEVFIPDVPYGIVFGRLRGNCKVPGCDCVVYSPVHNAQGCNCRHFPASHVDLGPSEPVTKLLSKTQSASTEPLIKSSFVQIEEWPKIFNPKCPPYTGALASLQEKLLKEKPAWIVDSKEVTFSGTLGEGTAAKVYRGHYLRDTVALKLMEFTGSGADGERLIKDLETEFRIMSQVRSTHVVNLHGVIVQPRICMIVEFCEKGALYDVLKRPDNGFCWTLLLKWFRQAVAGIHFLHSYTPQILHRDVKTLNLLVTGQNTIKVADFGLSRFNETAATSTLRKLRGTYCYTAPEVYFGEAYTVQSDVYSLGIILWELSHCLVSGSHQTPYAEYPNFSFDFQIIIQAAKKHLRPTILPQVPSLVTKLIQFLWAADSSERPTTKTLLSLIAVADQEYAEHSEEWEGCLSSETPVESSPERLLLLEELLEVGTRNALQKSEDDSSSLETSGGVVKLPHSRSASPTDSDYLTTRSESPSSLQVSPKLRTKASRSRKNSAPPLSASNASFFAKGTTPSGVVGASATSAALQDRVVRVGSRKKFPNLSQSSSDGSLSPGRSSSSPSIPRASKSSTSASTSTTTITTPPFTIVIVPWISSSQQFVSTVSSEFKLTTRIAQLVSGSSPQELTLDTMVVGIRSPPFSTKSTPPSLLCPQEENSNTMVFLCIPVESLPSFASDYLKWTKEQQLSFPVVFLILESDDTPPAGCLDAISHLPNKHFMISNERDLKKAFNHVVEVLSPMKPSGFKTPAKHRRPSSRRQSAKNLRKSIAKERKEKDRDRGSSSSNRERGRDTERESEREKEMEREKEKEREKDKDKEKEREKEKEKEKEKERQKEGYRDGAGREKVSEKEKEKEREKETEKEKEKEKDKGSPPDERRFRSPKGRRGNTDSISALTASSPGERVSGGHTKMKKRARSNGPPGSKLASSRSGKKKHSDDKIDGK